MNSLKPICMTVLLLSFWPTTTRALGQTTGGQSAAPQSTSSQKTAQNPATEKPNEGGSLLHSLSLVFGGGVVGVVITILSNLHMERNRRKASLLEIQLRDLYGPLQLFLSCNRKIYEHTAEIEQAASREFGGPDASPARTEMITATIGVNNRFFALADANRRRMFRILTKHYDLIEPGDAEVFAQFLIDCFRRRTEFGEVEGKRLPLDIHLHLTPVYSHRPELAELVNRRFNEKKTALHKLVGWSVFSFQRTPRGVEASKGKEGVTP